MNRARNTRELLLDAAADILETDGLAQLNTNAIAERAGVTPPTVYRNFKNKEEVMACLARRFTEAEKAWLSDARTSLEAAVSLDDLVDVVIDLYWESARQLRGIVALRSAMRVWPSLREEEEESLRSSTRTLAQLLAPHLDQLPRNQLAKVARFTVETVCSTVDRCYGAKTAEQGWKIEQLKLTVAAYLSQYAAN